MPVLGWGQIVDGKNLSEDKDISYLDIRYYVHPSKGYGVIDVEYGQKVKLFESPGRVTGEDGQPMPFKSLIDGLNKFSKWGWELVSTYSENHDGSSGVLHAILKRKEDK